MSNFLEKFLTNENKNIENNSVLTNNSVTHGLVLL